MFTKIKLMAELGLLEIVFCLQHFHCKKTKQSNQLQTKHLMPIQLLNKSKFFSYHFLKIFILTY